MSTSADLEACHDSLSDALSRVASVPSQSRQLHSILGGYCHQSRNLLNCLNMSLYLARRGLPADFDAPWKDLEGQYRRVEQFMDRLQAICRPIPLNVVRLPISLIFEEREASWTGQLNARGRVLRIQPPDSTAYAAFDPVRLVTGLDDLVAWRARVGPADSDLRVRWSSDSRDVHMTWDERRAGPRKARSATALGAQIEAFDSLTVPLLTRIVTIHGGRLVVRDHNGWRLDLHWPLDACSHDGEAQGC